MKQILTSISIIARRAYTPIQLAVKTSRPQYIYEHNFYRRSRTKVQAGYAISFSLFLVKRVAIPRLTQQAYKVSKSLLNKINTINLAQSRP